VIFGKILRTKGVLIHVVIEILILFDSHHYSIVFSSWKKTLDLAAKLLEMNKLRYDIVHGGLTLNNRLKVLEDFESPTGPNVLLMTLGTGAVGCATLVPVCLCPIADPIFSHSV
jgi:SNF2 family DNA or RNA helicase